MARAIAREVGSRQITVNVVAPGLIDTDMTAALGEDRLATMTEQVPLGRTGSAEDVAAVVGFLASEAAAYVTGVVLPGRRRPGHGLVTCTYITQHKEQSWTATQRSRSFASAP